MAGLKSVCVFVIPVELHGHYLTAVRIINIGSFEDPGNKTALYGSYTFTQNFLAEPKGSVEVPRYAVL
jgi:hypothetical protein